MGIIKSNSTAIIAGSSGALIGGALGMAAGYAIGRRKAKRKSRSRKPIRKAVRNRRKKRKGYQKGRKHKYTSHKRIHYTKNGQPYIIVAGGKARFIKRKSARISKKRRGGRY